MISVTKQKRSKIKESSALFFHGIYMVEYDRYDDWVAVRFFIKERFQRIPDTVLQITERYFLFHGVS